MTLDQCRPVGQLLGACAHYIDSHGPELFHGGVRMGRPLPRSGISQHEDAHGGNSENVPRWLAGNSLGNEWRTAGLRHRGDLQPSIEYSMRNAHVALADNFSPYALDPARVAGSPACAARAARQQLLPA